MRTRPNPSASGFAPLGRLRSICGPFRPSLRSPLRSRSPRTSPNPHNTVSALLGVFAVFRWYSRQVADLRNIVANG